MVEVSRWHNFSPAMKNHRAPQGLKEKEKEGGKKGREKKKKKKTLSKLVLALSLVCLLKLYHQQTRTYEQPDSLECVLNCVWSLWLPFCISLCLR